MTSADNDEKTTILDGDQTTLNSEIRRAKEQEACLIVIRGTPQGHRYFITQPEMTIGRDQTADIVVQDQSVSRKHAKVSKKDNGVLLTDMGSVNGTTVNGHKVPPGDSVMLEKEDMVRLGNSIFKYLPAGELEILFYGNLGFAANMDALTKIYNRAYLLEALEAEFKRAKALHTDLSILYCDLDFFKKINDTFGHEAGDHVLREFCALVRGTQLRPKDIFARYGGEEFVIVFANMNAASANEIAEKIRIGVQTHAFIYEGKRLPVTVSIGLAEINSEIQSAQTLLRAADKALYSAKEGGRNKVVLAT
jgi:two-component system, cell cycle response regulator